MLTLTDIFAGAGGSSAVTPPAARDLVAAVAESLGAA